MVSSLIFNNLLTLAEVVNWINHSQFLNPTSILLSVGSIFLSSYFYIKGKRSKKPRFATRSTNVISDTFQSIGDVKVYYKGEEITNLTVTKIAIWNDGNETINYSDLASADYLRIEPLDEVNIFNAELIFQSDVTNNLSILLSDKSVFVLFDYFDKGQGGIIKIIHSGKKTSALEMKGTFKGVGAIKRTIVANPSMSFLALDDEKSRNIRISFKTFLSVTFIMSCGSIIGSQFVTDSSDRWPLILFGSVYGVLSLFALLLSKSLPKSFKIFYDE